jgi:hypothetical protein
MDITYIPMAGGFVYLAVALDWFSWNSLTARQCQSRWRDGLAVDGCQCRSLVWKHLAPFAERLIGGDQH